jgi:cytochrome c peroxidase
MLKVFALTFFVLLYAEHITPIEQDANVDMQKALLGKKLFFDPILSSDGSVACVNCHHLYDGGEDGLDVSFGVGGQKGIINTPTVLNAKYNFVQFWDGRASDLKEQVLFPIQNPIEMNSSIKDVLKKLNASSYKEDFEEIYNEDVNQDNLADAIAEFEKALITPNAPFDKFLRGDDSAITTEAKRGYALFISKGCISCHNGKNVGGNMYQKFGNILPFDSKNPSKGRFAITYNDNDMYYFKVPTLRNVENGAPYFHDASAKTLKKAIIDMAEHQVGTSLSEKEVSDIEAFLKSLSGETPKILQDRK